jgi:hypothetical protein
MDLDARVSKHAHAIGWPRFACIALGISGLPLCRWRLRQAGPAPKQDTCRSGTCAEAGYGIESVLSVSPRASATTLPYPPG